ncbi:MAG: hypothetical protein HZC49_08430 [Nitrospirae bacterium]|nr:hypothetical protein [Nitrospirota bacterium]
MSTALLYGGFFSNCWNVVDTESFTSQDLSGGYAVGRMVKSRQDGIFSAGGLLGLGSSNEEYITNYTDRMEYQYSAYINGLDFKSYKPYNSQIGGQGILFGILDLLLPVSPQNKLQLIYMLTSLLSAVVVSLVVLWFYQEFGLCAALFVMTSALLSQRLVIYGRNIMWSTWAFYIPFISLAYFLRRGQTAPHYSAIKCGGIVFIAVFVKCLFNGYEYMTTTLIMMMVPFAYYYILDSINIKILLKLILAAVLSSCVAIFLSFTILTFQIASVKGNFTDGVSHIVHAFQKRTYPEDTHYFSNKSTWVVQSIETSAKKVLTFYLDDTFLDLHNYLSTSNPVISRLLFKIRYWDLIALFSIMSAALYSGKNISAFRTKHQSRLALLLATWLSVLAPISWFIVFKSHSVITAWDMIKLFLITAIVLYAHKNISVPDTEHQGRLALIIATWLSILAPVSWFIVFKSHSFLHKFMNSILWQMPFTFFGFAVCGLAIKSILRNSLDLSRHYLRRGAE